MRRLSLLAIALFTPVLFMLTTTSGCGKKPQKDGDGGDEEDKVTTAASRTTTAKSAGDGTSGGATRVALKAESFDGVIKGQVIYDGTPPEGSIPDAMPSSPDAKRMSHQSRCSSLPCSTMTGPPII